MKAKYYLRGLGIGVIVAVVIMGVTQDGRKETLSDSEIRERAAELGMVEAGGSLADMAETATPEEEKAETLTAQMPVSEAEERPSEAPAATPAGTPEEAATEAPAATPAGTPEEAATKAPAETPAETPIKTPTKTPAKTPKAAASETEAPSKSSPATVLIEVKSGDSSYAICQKLEEKGLITAAADFDSYLYTGGYDRRLRAGSFEIPADAEPEEIAKILCGMK